MAWDALRIVCELFIGFGISLILQGIGLFTPSWVTTETCDAIGLFYRCCGKNDTGCVVDGADSYLNKAVLGLQATSFTFMVLAVMSIIGIMKLDDDDDDDDDDDKEYGCFFTCLSCNVVVLYPIGGLFSVIGCIVLATEYSTSELSWGFYFSVTAGCYVILLTMCFSCVMMIASKSGNRIKPTVTPPQPSIQRNVSKPCVATTPSSGQITQGHRRSYTQAQRRERHETVQVKENVFLYRIQVFRFLHISGSK